MYVEILKKLKESHLLMIKSIIPDLKTFNWWQRILIFLFACVSIIFSIINVNSFSDDTLYLLNWENDKAYGVEYWRRVIMETSGIASFTGVICVVLITKGKFSNYFWGIINCIFYGTFAFAYGYAGDAQMNIMVFLPLQFVGVYMWNDNLDETNTARSLSLKWYEWFMILIFTGLCAVMFYYEIPAFAKALTGQYYFENNEIPHVLDAVTNGLSITAQILSLNRYWQQWIFWITIDCIQIAMFSGVAGYGIQFNILIMWILFLVNALFRLFMWWRRSLNQNTLTNNPIPLNFIDNNNNNNKNKNDIETGTW